MFYNSFNKIKYHIIFVIALCYGQEIPNDFYDFQVRKLNLDLGYNWKDNTCFGPVRDKHNLNGTDSLYINTRFGTFMTKNQKMLLLKQFCLLRLFW